MRWLLRILRWADKGTDLADRAGSLDDQAEVNLKFSPIARVVAWLVGAYGTVAAVVSGVVAYLSPWIEPYGIFGWFMATIAGTAALTAAGWMLGMAGLSLRDRWRASLAAGLSAPTPSADPATAPTADLASRMVRRDVLEAPPTITPGGDAPPPGPERVREIDHKATLGERAYRILLNRRANETLLRLREDAASHQSSAFFLGPVLTATEYQQIRSSFNAVLQRARRQVEELSQNISAASGISLEDMNDHLLQVERSVRGNAIYLTKLPSPKLTPEESQDWNVACKQQEFLITFCLRIYTDLEKECDSLLTRDSLTLANRNVDDPDEVQRPRAIAPDPMRERDPRAGPSAGRPPGPTLR